MYIPCMYIPCISMHFLYLIPLSLICSPRPLSSASSTSAPPPRTTTCASYSTQSRTSERAFRKRTNSYQNRMRFYSMSISHAFLLCYFPCFSLLFHTFSYVISISYAFFLTFRYFSLLFLNFSFCYIKIACVFLTSSQWTCPSWDGRPRHSRPARRLQYAN